MKEPKQYNAFQKYYLPDDISLAVIIKHIVSLFPYILISRLYQILIIIMAQIDRLLPLPCINDIILKI